MHLLLRLRQDELGCCGGHRRLLPCLLDARSSALPGAKRATVGLSGSMTLLTSTRVHMDRYRAPAASFLPALGWIRCACIVSRSKNRCSILASRWPRAAVLQAQQGKVQLAGVRPAGQWSRVPPCQHPSHAERPEGRLRPRSACTAKRCTYIAMTRRMLDDPACGLSRATESGRSALPHGTGGLRAGVCDAARARVFAP